MNGCMTLVRLIARPMLASMFVVGGYSAFKNAEASAQRAQPVTDKLVGVAEKAAPQVQLPKDPVTLVKANAVVHMAGGTMLALGKLPRLTSAVLAASLIPTTLAGHSYWEENDPHARANQKVHFFKNVSMLGGLLLAGVDTEGRPGLAWRAKHATKAARRESKRLGKQARRESKLAAKSIRG